MPLSVYFKIIKIRYLLLRRFDLYSYPWRFLCDPYKVLISEYCLQRTKSSQVIPVYSELISEFPNLISFTKADKLLISNIMKPLGLNWRINGMIDSVHSLYNKYGEIPLDYQKLIDIHGIGQYIAGAVICFTQNKKLVLIDANIVRVIGRLFGADLSGEARRRKEIYNYILITVPSSNPRNFYYAVIDLAHTYCLPSNEICSECILKNLCLYCLKKKTKK